jgi:hypothetical protein
MSRTIPRTFCREKPAIFAKHWLRCCARFGLHALGEHDKALIDDANCSDRILG